MTDSRSTSTRRRALKYAGVTGLSGVAGLTGLSLTSQPALALSESVTLPSGLTAGTVNVSSYELQYAELDTASDVTITYILRTSSETVKETHTVPITESTGTVMTGSHSISVPSGDVSLELQLEHSSVGTVSTNESAPTTVESAIPDSVDNHWPADESSGTTLFDDRGTADGTITGATWVSLADAIGGFYLDYDYTDNHVDLGASLDYVDAGDYTLTGFAFLDSTVDTSTNEAVLIGKSSGSDGVQLDVFGGNLRLTHPGVATFDSGFSPPADTWFFVGARYDASATSATIDFNDQTASGSLSTPSATSANAAIAARNPSAPERFWGGGIDETTAAGTRLTDSEISDLRNRRSDV